MEALDVGPFPTFTGKGKKMISGAAKVWKVILEAVTPAYED